MTLEEAITILEGEAHLAERQPETGVYHALKLLIEAGKEVQRLRPHIHYRVNHLLPGETKGYCKFCGIAHTSLECPDRSGEK